MVFTLARGATVLIRPIEPGDKEKLATGLRRLSDESIRKRFLAAKPRFTAAELRYLTEVDGTDHVALLAVRDHDPNFIVGVARFVRWRERPDAAEAAIVVGDPWQGQGVGRWMGLALADLARTHGVRRFTASLLSDNRAAHRVFETISARLHAEHHHGVEELVAELDRAA